MDLYEQSDLNLIRLEIGVFLLLDTVCFLYLVLPSCPFSRSFPYLHPMDAGGCHSAQQVS